MKNSSVPTLNTITGLQVKKKSRILLHSQLYRSQSNLVFTMATLHYQVPLDIYKYIIFFIGPNMEQMHFTTPLPNL